MFKTSCLHIRKIIVKKPKWPEMKTRNQNRRRNIRTLTEDKWQGFRVVPLS